MKRALKFLHTLGAAGVIGALAAHLLILVNAPGETLVEMAAVRQAIAAVTRGLLLPALAVVLVSGLLAMALHRPFHDARWVWIKALLGIAMFEGTLGAVEGTADRLARLALEQAAGGAPLPAELLRHEWLGLWTVLALALANIALAVWRPRLRPRQR
jgi:hypothetical protein